MKYILPFILVLSLTACTSNNSVNLALIKSQYQDCQLLPNVNIKDNNTLTKEYLNTIYLYYDCYKINKRNKNLLFSTK